MLRVKGSNPPPPQTITIDDLSPYFLTSSDHLGLNFIRENLLHNGNYSERKNEMINGLFAKNKVDFIDNSLPIPEEGLAHLMN